MRVHRNKASSHNDGGANFFRNFLEKTKYAIKIDICQLDTIIIQGVI